MESQKNSQANQYLYKIQKLTAQNKKLKNKITQLQKEITDRCKNYMLRGQKSTKHIHKFTNQSIRYNSNNHSKKSLNLKIQRSHDLFIDYEPQSAIQLNQEKSLRSSYVDSKSQYYLSVNFIQDKLDKQNKKQVKNEENQQNQSLLLDDIGFSDDNDDILLINNSKSYKDEQQIEYIKNERDAWIQKFKNLQIEKTKEAQINSKNFQQKLKQLNYEILNIKKQRVSLQCQIQNLKIDIKKREQIIQSYQFRIQQLQATIAQFNNQQTQIETEHNIREFNLAIQTNSFLIEQQKQSIKIDNFEQPIKTVQHRLKIMNQKNIQNIKYIKNTLSNVKPDQILDTIQNQYKLIKTMLTIYDELIFEISGKHTLPYTTEQLLQNSELFNKLFEKIQQLESKYMKQQQNNPCPKLKGIMHKDSIIEQLDSLTEVETFKQQQQSKLINGMTEELVKHTIIQLEKLVNLKTEEIQELNNKIKKFDSRQNFYKLTIDRWSQQNKQLQIDIQQLQNQIKEKEMIIEKNKQYIGMFQKINQQKDCMIAALKNQKVLLEQSQNIKNDQIEKLKQQNKKKQDKIKKLNKKLSQMAGLANVSIIQQDNCVQNNEYVKRAFTKKIVNKKIISSYKIVQDNPKKVQQNKQSQQKKCINNLDHERFSDYSKIDHDVIEIKLEIKK